MTDVVVRLHPHPWRVFTATSIGVIAVFVSMSGLTVALPTLTRDLGASPAASSWILVGYMVVTTALILVFGRLADILGRRPLYLAGLLVFVAASALCVASPSAGWLIGARILQGVGAAAVVTNNTALLADTFAPRQLGQALGWNATVAAVGSIAGPVIGGAATALIGWRGLFVAVLLIGIVATATSVWVIPRSRRPAAPREPFDLAGAVLSSIVLTVVVLALTPGLSTIGWLPWLYGGVGLAAATGFVLVQTHRAHPLVDVSLFATRGVGLVLIAALINALATYAVALIISLYGQTVDGTSPFVAGVLVMPIALGTVVAAALAGMLVTRASPRVLTVSGMTLNAVGLAGMTLTLSPDGGSLALTSVFLSTIGCGIGLFMTPSTNALMLTVPGERRGIANGMRSTLQNVGNLLSTALVLALVPMSLAAMATVADLGRFVDGLRMAGFALTAVSVVGVAVCLGLPHTNPTAATLEFPTETMPTMKESA